MKLRNPVKVVREQTEKISVGVITAITFSVIALIVAVISLGATRAH